MTMPSGETSPPRQSWIKGALIASLALNLLIIGVVAGGIWRFRHHGGFGPPGERGLIGFVNHMAGDRAQQLRGDLTAKRESLRPLRREVREAWQASNEALTAEPFDKEKFKASQVRVRDAGAKIENAISDATADLAEKLTPEERQRLRKWREHQRDRMFGHHSHHGGPGKSGEDD